MAHERLDEIAGRAAQDILDGIRKTCPECKRGAMGLPTPDLEDLEALIQIRDGFDAHRRNFTPEMRDVFRRMDRVISYLHSLVAGTTVG